MKTLSAAFTLISVVLALSILPAVGAATVSLEATDTPIDKALDSIAQQCGAKILLDGDIKGNVTATLTNMSADKAIETVAKLSHLTWKKVDLCGKPDAKVSVEKLKAAISAMAALDVPGLSIADSTSGAVSMFAKDLGQDATSQLKLPEGQKWQTYYLISKPVVEKKDQTAAKDKDTPEEKNEASEAAERANRIASMDPEERQHYFEAEMNVEMRLPAEMRVQIWKDRFTAFGSLMSDPVMREQLGGELREAFRQLRPGGGEDRGPWGGQREQN